MQESEEYNNFLSKYFDEQLVTIVVSETNKYFEHFGDEISYSKSIVI